MVNAPPFGGGAQRELAIERRARVLDARPPDGVARGHTLGYIGGCDQVALHVGPRGDARRLDHIPQYTLVYGCVQHQPDRGGKGRTP